MMKYVKLADGSIHASQIILGCGHFHKISTAQTSALVDTALEQGINFFDHADVYGSEVHGTGKSEEVFGEVLKARPGLREDVFIQSKCGLVNYWSPETYYSFDPQHIQTAVEGSLKRLQTDYLDVLLLHRPDPLMEPKVVGEAFQKLHDSGKVRHFGVSNMNPLQMQLLQSGLKQRLIVNQVQFSVVHTPMLDAGLHVNMACDAATMRDGGTIEYARLHGVGLQAWSPFHYGENVGIYLGSDQYPELNAVLNELAARYDVPPAAIAIAWILRHPARIQPLVGSTKPRRLMDACRACDVSLTREDWWRLYKAAGNTVL